MSALLEATPFAAESDARTSFVRQLLRRPAAAVPLVVLVALAAVCLAAPLLAPYDPTGQDLMRVLTGPTGHNLLGTDTLGRDVLSRLMYGGRRSILSIAEGLAVVLMIGVPLGLIAGYADGWTDRILSRIAEIVMAIPAIILVLVVLAVVPHDEDVAMVTFGILGAPSIMRVVRGTTLKIREELYIAAARTSGVSHLRIVTRHILPRAKGPVIVQATLFSAYALLFESAISYLGISGDPATPTWGGMVAEASQVLQQQSWLLFPPGIVIAVTILCLGLLGDAIRDVAVMDTATSKRRSRHRRDHLGRDPAFPANGAVGGRAGALLSVRDLTVTLTERDRETTLVDGVSFDVLTGETLGLIGESGCGKSVTALAVLRLLAPSLRVTQGHAYWEKEDLLGMDDAAFDELRGSALAYVSQEPQASLDPTFTIGSQLGEIIRHHDGVSRAAARARAFELLRLVELKDPRRVAASRAYELSGGMAQRVAMALALAGRPRLLIADEPTTALDVTVQAELLGLLRRIQHETGMAILLITHNWGVVADICDRTLVMYAGQIVEASPVQQLFDHPLHPYSLGLLETHPSLARRGTPLTAMRGNVPSPGTWPPACRFAPRCPFVTDQCVAAPVPLAQPRPDHASRCVRIEDIFAEASTS